MKEFIHEWMNQPKVWMTENADKSITKLINEWMNKSKGMNGL